MADKATTHTGSGDFHDLDDRAFLAERRRVRELLEYCPESSADRADLERAYGAMTDEFDRRARGAWASAELAATRVTLRAEDKGETSTN
jgi:hypothetical protein